MSSGVLNIYSSSAIDAIHTGLLNWQKLHYSIVANAKLLITLLSELTTYDEVGTFLSLFLSSSFISQYQHKDIIELLYLIITHPDIRDLSGDRKQLYTYLEDYMEDIQLLIKEHGVKVGMMKIMMRK